MGSMKMAMSIKILIDELGAEIESLHQATAPPDQSQLETQAKEMVELQRVRSGMPKGGLSSGIAGTKSGNLGSADTSASTSTGDAQGSSGTSGSSGSGSS